MSDAVQRGVPDVGDVMVLDLDAQPDPRPDDLVAVSRSRCPTVGFASSPISPSLAAVLDVGYVPDHAVGSGRHCVGVADPAAAAGRTAAVAQEHLDAVTVLRGVMRTGVHLDERAAIDLESLAYSTLLGGPDFARWLTAHGPPSPPDDVDDPVLVQRDSATLTITLNRPSRRNAYGRALRDALTEALDIAVVDPTVVRVVLRGNGPSFCSGGDLGEFGTTPDLVTAHFVRSAGGAGARMAVLGARVEAHMHGACVGAGLEIPAFAGRVIADPATTMRLPEVSMGLIPGAGGTVSVPRRAGRWRTFHLAVTGDPIDAPTALDWGIADEIRPLRGC